MASNRKPGGRRFGLLAGAAAAIVAISSSAASAQQAHLIQISVQSQDLGDALNQLARQTNVQIVFRPELVRGRQAPALSGNLTTQQALDRMLEGTGLTYRSSGENAYVILAQANQDPQSPSGADQSASSAQEEEIIVTAQKREERLQDVPVPVTALSGQDLSAQNQLRLQDYFASVPGLNVAPTSQASQTLTLRGLTTGGAGNPTVGIMIDGVPYGASTNNGGGLAIPDLDPSDLQRVEVLRGPQGTLYGASSIGGLINFVTVEPSTAGFSGRLQAGLSGVENGEGVGYNVRAAFNVPLGESLALRASAFNRLDPGYIDNVQTGADGVNEQEVTGGRLALLWSPTDALSVQLSALLQRTEMNGSFNVDPMLGDLAQSELPGTGGFEREAQAYSAIVSADLGAADLTSVTGYSINDFRGLSDLTYALGFFTNLEFGVTGTSVLDDAHVEKISQEFRLDMPLGSNVDWLLGAFYTREESDWFESIYAVDDPTGDIVGDWGDIIFPSTYEEYALFTDFTVRFSERFDVQFGARQSWITQTSEETTTGPYATLNYGVTPVIRPELEIDADALTYLITPRFRLSDDTMIYARFASGYRTGGPNVPPGVPDHYDPDTSNTYEVGLKSDFFGGALNVDASIYHIDWQDIQIPLIDSSFQLYKDNAGGAQSQGIELTLRYQPTPSLSIDTVLTWQNAELTDDFPAGATAYGADGDRLPYSSEFSGSISAEQTFPLANMEGYIGGAVTYVGERLGPFVSTFGTPDRQPFDDYTQFDLRAGMRGDQWSVNLFANNLSDERGILSGGKGSFPPFNFQYIQPRTIGVSVTHNF
jgi:iron complex outermembrane recepter protein